MHETISFGTSGWRGVIAEEVTFPRLRKLTRAITRYLKDNEQDRQGIVIGYDTRFFSSEFAREVACVSLEEGIEVVISDTPSPTPVISFEILRRKAGGGINITASHNPYYYSGVKFSPAWGGPAEPEVTRIIEKNYLNALPDKPREDYAYYIKKGKIEAYNPIPTYLSALRQVIPFSLDFTFKVVFDPLYGTSIPYLKTIFKGRKNVSLIHKKYDPFFGGLEPVPYEHILIDLKKQVKRNSALLGLALDGDADRFGVISHDGTFITPNEVFSILAYHLGKRGQAGIGRTVSTTRMLDVIAKHHQVKLLETPVGFKYLGALIRDGQIYLGGEESGGLSIKGWVPEKDGILAVLLVLGLCAEQNIPPAVLIDDLYKIFGKFYNQRVDIKFSERQANKVRDFIDNFSETTFFGLKIKAISRKDGLLITFEDLSWCLLRQSGTENMIRFYYESQDKEVYEVFEHSTLPFLA